MRLVAGQKYIRGLQGEVMPYTPAMAKIAGCVEFIQQADYSDEFQLVENENMQRFRGRRNTVIAPPQTENTETVVKKAVVPQPQIQQHPQPQVKKVIKPVPNKKETFVHMDITEEMASDLKASDGPAELE